MTRPCPCDDAGIFYLRVSSLAPCVPAPVRRKAATLTSLRLADCHSPLESRSRAQMLNLDKELSRHAGDIHVRYSSHGLSNK